MAKVYTATQIINTIRREAGEDYISRVPVATRNNLKQIGDMITNPENLDLYNAFIKSMINKVAFTFVKSKMFKNPLAVLKHNVGRPYGNMVEDTFIEPSKDVNFKGEVDSTCILKTYHPKVETAYYGLARKSTYANSFERQEIIQAFTSDTNFMSFFNGIITAMYSGDNIDEFLCMKNCIGGFIDNEVVKVIDTGDIESLEGSKSLIKKIGLFSSNFSFPSTAYSPYNEKYKKLNPSLEGDALRKQLITTFCESKDQVLIITAEALNEITYEVLANIFNLELTEIKALTIVVDEIPSDKYKIYALLCDKETIQGVDHTYCMENHYIPGKMITNYFLNHWGWLWCSIFPNAVAFGRLKPTEGQA